MHLGLIRFTHGLGDCVQLTSVLRHLAFARPDWQWDVAVTAGKRSCLRGLSRESLDYHELQRPDYSTVLELAWDEPDRCYQNSASTKVERCLIDVFGLTPQPDLAGYTIRCNAEELAAARIVRESLGPFALLHYEGNTGASEKNLSHTEAAAICELVRGRGMQPVILDWDRRSQIVDSGLVQHWPGPADAAAIAALTTEAALAIGIDSGPLHVFAATRTPTLGVWTRRHPLHYMTPAATNVLNLVPRDHERFLRRIGRENGAAFFQHHYRQLVYEGLLEGAAEAMDQLLGSG